MGVAYHAALRAGAVVNPINVMLEAAAFVRYTDIVVLGCAAAAVIVVRWRRAARLPSSAVAWWLASVAVFGAGVVVFDDLVYGGPFTTGYRPG